MPKLSDKFKSVPGNIEKYARAAIKEGLQDIEDEASTVHRYTTRSGNLSKAFVQEMTSSLSGSVILDGSKSGAGAYDYAIHQGHSGPKTYQNIGNQTWKSDPFLTNAGKTKGKEVIKKITKAVNKAIKKSFK